MKRLEVYDPPMCCATGVCGPSVDPALPRFAADVDWLKGRGVSVERFNLAQQPEAFARNELVKRALAEQGNDCLPLVLLDGQIASSGKYPSRTELAAMTGLDAPETESLWSSAVEELVAVGASVACNCMPCLKYHTDRARSFGVSDDDIAKAVAMADTVKQVPANLILQLANRYLNGKLEEVSEPQGCCVPTPGSSGSKCCG